LPAGFGGDASPVQAEDAPADLINFAYSNWIGSGINSFTGFNQKPLIFSDIDF